MRKETLLTLKNVDIRAGAISDEDVLFLNKLIRALKYKWNAKGLSYDVYVVPPKDAFYDGWTVSIALHGTCKYTGALKFFDSLYKQSAAWQAESVPGRRRLVLDGEWIEVQDAVLKFIRQSSVLDIKEYWRNQELLCPFGDFDGESQVTLGAQYSLYEHESDAECFPMIDTWLDIARLRESQRVKQKLTPKWQKLKIHDVYVDRRMLPTQRRFITQFRKNFFEDTFFLNASFFTQAMCEHYNLEFREAFTQGAELMPEQLYELFKKILCEKRENILQLEEYEACLYYIEYVLSSFGIGWLD